MYIIHFKSKHCFDENSAFINGRTPREREKERVSEKENEREGESERECERAHRIQYGVFLCYSRLVIGNSSLWVTDTDMVSCVLSGPSTHIVIEQT